jgi:hypothetical protein
LVLRSCCALRDGETAAQSAEAAGSEVPRERAPVQVLIDALVQRVLERAGHELIRVAQRNPIVLL